MVSLGGCAEATPCLHVLYVVLVCLVQLFGLCVVYTLVPPSVEASLALTEPCCASRSVPPKGRRVWTQSRKPL